MALIGLIVNGLDVNSLCFNWPINANDGGDVVETNWLEHSW